MTPTALIILAAGQGTRMNSDLPKVLHPLGGQPLLYHALDARNALCPDHIVVVTGCEAPQVKAAALRYDPKIHIAHQAKQMGTGHAALQAGDALSGFTGDAFILFGDTPFVSADTIARLVEARKQHDLVLLGFEPKDPLRYGRLVMQGEMLERVVEYKDATQAERKIPLCNSGILIADAQVLFDLLRAVTNENASGEYYLPDVIAIARARGLAATAVLCDEAETQGINTRAELARAETTLQAIKRAEAFKNGVTLVGPDTVFFAADTVIGRDTIIEPHVVFGPGVTVESGVTLRAFSHLEGCHVARGSVIGPYARLRPGAELAEDVRVGNFVEVKNAQIAEGAKLNHLSYIGDADIGAGSNIGAGTVTCNYDGVMKHRTVIGQRAFIGSNTMLVAPVTLGDEAMTGSGSVITRDVPAGDLALARARQENKPGLARKLMETLRTTKAKKDKGQK